MVYLFVSLLLLGVGYSACYTETSRYWLLLWVFLALFWGTSYIYAPDIPGYIKYFNNDTYNWFATGFKLPFRNFELGFNVLSCLIRSITSQYYVFQLLLFSSELMLVMVGLRRFLDNRQAFIFTCLLFFLLPTNLLSAMRQGIPIALFIFSLYYIKEQKLLPFVLLVAFGSLFHSSSVYLLPFYFLPRLYGLLSRRTLLIGFLVALDLCFALHFSISDFLIKNFSLILDTELMDVSKYERYTNVEGIVNESNFGIMKLVEINVAYVLFVLDRQKGEDNMKLLKLLFILYFALNALVGGILAHRVTYYLTIPYQLCVILSFIRLGGMIFRERSMAIGYLMAGAYIIGLQVFKFNNVFEGTYVYQNLFIQNTFGV